MDEAILDEVRRHLPGAPIDGIDPRCYLVLRTLAPFYRLPILADELAPMFPLPLDEWEDARRAEDEYPTVRRPDSGVERCWKGIAVQVTGDLATWDADELTRLVLAAHEHHCRVSLAPTVLDYDDEWEEPPVTPLRPTMTLQIMPRDPAETDSPLMLGHPGLDRLAERAGGQ